jgi:hypothetical protein
MTPRGNTENERETTHSHEIERATTNYDKEQLQEGVAKRAGGVAVIRAGAALDDAISSTKAAVTEGIVPGGGQRCRRSRWSPAGCRHRGTSNSPQGGARPHLTPKG